MPWQTRTVATDYDVLAPDGSEIRFLPQVRGGSMVHCILRPGQTTQAVRHRTVDELWLCLAGRGQVWRRQGSEEEIVDISRGVALSIPLGVEFQFRATSTDPLEIVIVTMPPWPGADEAIPVEGAWAPTVPSAP